MPINTPKMAIISNTILATSHFVKILFSILFIDSDKASIFVAIIASLTEDIFSNVDFLGKRCSIS